MLKLAFLALPLVAHGGECQPSALAENRTKWDTSRVDSYSFVLWEHQGWSSASPVRVVVQRGQFVSSRYVRYVFRSGVDVAFDITEVSDAQVPDRNTVPKLFESVARHLGAARASVAMQCEFHPEYGFPMQFSWDLISAFDEEFGFRVSDFEIL